MKKTTEKNLSRRIISVPVSDDLYRKIERHVATQKGTTMQDCLADAISEVVELWDDYDRMISSLNVKNKIPLF